jgi:hypothetical protein
MTPPQQIVNVDHGIGSIGGTLINPQVNNYGPPAARIAYTEERSVAQDGGNILIVHIRTDQPVSGAQIGISFSGPFTWIPKSSDESNPTLTNAPMYSVNAATIVKNGQELPNTLALLVDAPSVLTPNMDLIFKVKSSEPVRVTKIGFVNLKGR